MRNGETGARSEAERGWPTVLVFGTAAGLAIAAAGLAFTATAGRAAGQPAVAISAARTLVVSPAPEPSLAPAPVLPPAPAAEVTAPAKPVGPPPLPPPPIDAYGGFVAVSTYGVLYRAVTEGAMGAASGALGLAATAAAAVGLLWASTDPKQEDKGYWKLVPASIGGLGGVVAGDFIARSVVGYSPYVVGVAGYVPLTSLTFGRIANSAFVYLTGILGAQAAALLYDRPAPVTAAAPSVVPPPPPPKSPIAARTESSGG